MDATCLMMLGGTSKQINMWTSKPLIPSPCDYQDQCNITESSEISPIVWIQYDGVCKRRLHQFCAGITTVPKSSFFFSRSPLKQEECVAKNKITTLHSNFERFVFTISIDVTLSLSAFQNEWLSLGH